MNMDYFNNLLEAENHLPYVLTAYLIAFFILLILSISSKIKNTNLEKKYSKIAGKNES